MWAMVAWGNTIPNYSSQSAKKWETLTLVSEKI